MFLVWVIEGAFGRWIGGLRLNSPYVFWHSRQ